MKRAAALLLLSVSFLLSACGPCVATQSVPPSFAGAPAEPPTYTFSVVNRWPHDPGAFTEGLVYDQGTLWESTGLNGASTLRKVDLQSGHVAESRPLAADYFGEGLTLFGGKLIQLTWQTHLGFVYDPGCLCPERTFSYDGEGWGLTHDDQSLIMSDGTERIRFLDPQTFAVVRTIAVSDHGRPLTNLNELEYIDGEIYANIWQTDRIVRIDPTSGAILGWIDLAGLLPATERGPTTDVLNGIAYDAATGLLLVTGKNWPALFQIALISPP